MMFTPTSYDSNFPPLVPQTDQNIKVASRSYVQSTKVTAEGQLSPLTLAEEVLNWQTQNATIQNRTLQQIDLKMDRVLSQTQSIDKKVDSFTLHI